MGILDVSIYRKGQKVDSYKIDTKKSKVPTNAKKKRKSKESGEQAGQDAPVSGTTE